jgi:hypothetical protein
MGLDIRIPLGLMFLITGCIMAIFGLFTRGSAIYAMSQGINLNLTLGALMFVFGVVMFLLGRRPQKSAVSQIEGTTRPLKTPRGH